VVLRGQKTLIEYKGACVKSPILLSLLLASILLSCESKAGTGALVGGGLGVGAGALIGGGQGALIGGAVGVVSGAIVGHILDEEDRANVNSTSPNTSKKLDRGERLSVNDIIALHEAGISDQKIIALIDKTDSHYTLSTSDIHRLENAGVSDKVINYMMEH